MECKQSRPALLSLAQNDLRLSKRPTPQNPAPKALQLAFRGPCRLTRPYYVERSLLGTLTGSGITGGPFGSTRWAAAPVPTAYYLMVSGHNASQLVVSAHRRLLPCGSTKVPFSESFPGQTPNACYLVNSCTGCSVIEKYMYMEGARPP